MNTEIKYINEPYEVEIVKYKILPWVWWLLSILLVIILLRIAVWILSKYLHRY